MSTLLQLPGPGLVAQPRTLADAVPVFLQWLRLVRRRSENTCRAYGEDLRMFLGFCAQARLERAEEVSFRHVEFYLGWLQTARGVKPQTANRHLHALRTFWTWMRRDGLAQDNPAAETFMLPTQKKLPGYLTVPEQERLLAALAENRSPAGRRDHALVATALFTGLRCTELAMLQVAHVDLEAGRLRVVNGKGRKDRELPIIPRLEAILRDYLERVRPRLVGRPVGRGSLSRGKWRATITGWKPGNWYLQREIDGRCVSKTLRTTSREEAERLRDAGGQRLPDPEWAFVNVHPAGAYRLRRNGQPLLGRTIFHIMRRVVSPILGRPVHPHMLRHSFASRLRENGADLQLIQEALGHASINTTTMYAHLTTSKRRQDLARLLK